MSDSRPLAIDLFTGLHGWAEGLIAAGWRVIGFDIEDMSRKLGEPLPPEHFHLVIQDVLTLHGSQFRDAGLIVGSSPCQEFSYRAMPWKRAKALGPPEIGKRLFDAQFRIRREASEAAGRHIPLVVENVRGARPWVGRARASFGSYYLWGDVPALMPVAAAPSQADSIAEHMKAPGGGHVRDGAKSTFRLTNPAEGRKHHGDWFRDPTTPTRQGGQAKVPAKGWLNDGDDPERMALLSSKSPARQAASAKIAKIPFTLAEWVGRAWLPYPDGSGCLALDWARGWGAHSAQEQQRRPISLDDLPLFAAD